MDALAMTLENRSVQGKSRLLYMYLSVKDLTASPIIWLDKFYCIINLRDGSEDYSDQWEFITNFVFEKLKTVYFISGEELLKVLSPDLNDFKKYGFFPWDDPYYESSEEEVSDGYCDNSGNWIHPHLVKIDNQLRSK